MKQPSNGTDDQKNSTTFAFVNYEEPTDATDRKVRKQVRSHVSRYQHRIARERLRDAVHTTSSDTNPEKEVGTEVPTNTATANGSSLAWINTTAASRLGPVSSKRRRLEANNTTAATKFQQPAGKANKEATPDDVDEIPRTALMKSFSQGKMSFRTIALHDSENTVGLSLEGLQLELSSVMALYQSICTIQAKNFALLCGAAEKGKSTWGRFYSFVFTDPILLSTAILLGVRNQLDILDRSLSGQTAVGVVQIERFLMSSIRSALQDPVRGISDQIIITVALCAAYEIKHGSGACYHTHMRGLMQMVSLRGGLQVIGNPDPYISRLLIWIDINTSRLAGCEPYFQERFDQLASKPHANTTMFRAKGVPKP